MDQFEFDLDEFAGEWMNEEIRRSRRRSRPPRRRLRPAARISRKPGLAAAPTRRLPAQRLRWPGKYPRPLLPLPYPRPGGRPHVDIKIETPAEPAASGGAPAPFEPPEPPPPQGSEFLRWVQATLNQVLNLRLPVDGLAGPETRRAIRSFQQRAGLPADGIVGPETRQALVKARKEAAASAPQGEILELEIDRRSRDYIRWVQAALNRIRQAGLSVDGISGPLTRQAVIAFQRSRNLTPDGIVGPITERALQAAGAPAPPQSSSQPSPPATPGAPPIYVGSSKIQDRTHLTPRSKRKRQRSPAVVTGLVLHQMAFSRGSANHRYDNVTAHYAILPDGQILQLHPITAYLYASNAFNATTVAVEFAGNFPNTRGRCWEAGKFGCHRLTPAQIEAGRYLVTYLKKTIGLRYIYAHRQSSRTRTNDPGPDIWYHVGQWAIDHLGLSDGGPNYKVGTGAPIPPEWRTWGQRGQNPELSAGFPTRLQGEISRGNPGYFRWVQSALNRIQGAGLVVDGILGPRTRQAVIAFQRSRNLTPDGLVGPLTEKALQAAGAPAPPQSSSQPSAGFPPPSPGLSGLRRNIVQIALQELKRWGNGRIKESQRTIRPVLESYWRTGVGWLPSKPNWWSSVPWSAAFISWVMRQAGAGPAFRYAGGHSYYIAAAKQNRLANSSNPIQAYRISERSPQEGDLVCKSRAGSGATYDNIRGGMSTHCDIVVARQPGKLLTVGGNVSDSVKITEVPIDAAGRIQAPLYFAVIKTGR